MHGTDIVIGIVATLAVGMSQGVLVGKRDVGAVICAGATSRLASKTVCPSLEVAGAHGERLRGR